MRPQACERAATAQFDNCSVTNIFRCQGQDAAFWIETLDADNVLTIETRNASHGSMSITYVGLDGSMRITQSEMHPREIVRTGSGEDRIVGEILLFGMARPISGETRYAYAGESKVIAGETMARIDFVGSVTLPPPMPEIVGSGAVLYSERLDLLVEEELRFDVEGTVEVYRLAHLSLPGQSGFGDETPGYGCGQLSRLHASQSEAPS